LLWSSYDSALSNEEFSFIMPIDYIASIVIDVIDVARFIIIFVISLNIFFIYAAVHVCTNSIINKKK